MSTKSERPAETDVGPEDPEDWTLEDWIVIGVLPRLIGVGAAGAIIFVIYLFVAAPPFASCGSSSLYGSYHGGAASSVKAALVFGALLWLAAGVAASRFRSKRTILLVGFLVLYLLGLILLGTVIAPLIWGPRVCG
jgi:hypothetical protein